MFFGCAHNLCVTSFILLKTLYSIKPTSFVNILCYVAKIAIRKNIDKLKFCE